MSKLADRFKRLKPAAPEDVPEGVDHDDLKGVDERRRAELKAEAAGKRRRRETGTEDAVEREIGGPKGLEPTRYGDWEKAGRCFDF